MKNLSKLIIVSVLLFSALSVSGYAEITKPYYVYSSNSEIRAMLAVKHNFGSVVSAELTSSQIQTLLSKGVYLQEVKIRHIDEVYCYGRCGLSSGKTYGGKLCYCDSYCTYAGDCCPDSCQYCGYNCGATPPTTTTTTVPQTGYCSGKCGLEVYKPYNGKTYCSCQSVCKILGNCCPDVCQYCGYNCGTTPTTTTSTTTTVKTTTTTIKTTTTTYGTTTTTYNSGSYCSGMCGLKVNKPYNGYSYCYCSSYCKLLGNCCPDVCQYCGYNCGTTTTTTTVKTTTTTIKTTTTTVPSTGYCSGMCGQIVFKPYNGKSYCSCQSVCKTLGNCCPDSCAYCGYNCGTTPTTTTTTVYVYRNCYPGSQKPWGVTKVNGGSGGSGITVAVLDTGVDTNHPDLVGNIKTCVTKVTHYALDSYSCEDAQGHGTHVAGSVAANGGADGKGIYGVAPQANLMIIKVCDRTGNCYSDDAAAGIRYAADNGANIISMSFSGPELDPVERDAIDYAVNKGVLVVAAAGNTGPGANTIRYPAAYYKVVSVAAIDSLNNPASFSSRGINDGDFVREEREIEFAAPGVSILSTYYDGCYATGEGTSQATPHVSGLAAKIWKGSASATRSYLKSIAKDIYTYGDDTATGFGLPVSP